MDIINLLIIFVIGGVTSTFGTLVGGGSLITIPTLIFLGLAPHTAIGTNALGITGLLVAGGYKFHQKRMIDYKIGLLIGICALSGAFLGANLVLQINETLLKKVIGLMVIVMLVFIIVNPQLGIRKIKHSIKKSEYLIGAVLSFCLGIYHGFYGAATGTFFSYILILLFKQTFLESAATRKVPTLAAAVMAVIIFAINGVIHYALGIALFVGSSIGSYAGAHYSDKIGNVWIKRLFCVIVFIMAIKLLI